MYEFKLHYIDSGFCRIYYYWKNDKGERIYYCFQQDFKDEVNFYRCSADPDYCEPEYKAKMKCSMIGLFEPPKGDSKLEQLTRKYIEEH